MNYQAERFYCAASIEGEGCVWEETLAAQDVDGIIASLRSPDKGRNVLAENGYDLSKLEITIRAVPLSDMDKHFQDARRAQVAQDAAQADLDAAEAAERAQRVADGVAHFEAELKALGVEFELGSADSFATVSRAGVVLGTVSRPSRIHGQNRWTFHTPDGAYAFGTPGRLTMLSRLARRFA